MAAPIPIVHVDAFTAEPFAGNPAAVCVLPEARDATWMQAVAADMNLSETAFLVQRGDGFALRWFTPLVEVALCGHATLASAHALWEAGELGAGESARFHTASGLLTCERRGAWIEMAFPPKVATEASPPPGLLAALGTTARWVGRNKFDYLIEVDAEATVRALAPDVTALAAVDMRGVMVTARAAGGPYDFVSRFFAPRAGIAEDPVTGSAHCALGPFWAGRLGRRELVGFQASRRGGVVRVRVDDDRVHLAGQAVTVWRGTLLL